MFLSKNTQNLTFSFSHSQRNQRKGTWLDPQCWTLSKGSFAQEDPVLKPLSHTQPCMAKSQSPAVGICPTSSSATSGSPTTHKFDCTPGEKIDWSLVSCLLIGWPHDKSSPSLKSWCQVLNFTCVRQQTLFSKTISIIISSLTTLHILGSPYLSSF